MRVLSYLGRFAVMGLVTGWFLGRYLLGRTWLVLSRRDPEARRAAVAALKGRILRGMLSALGATFVKLGQVLSTRPDLLAAEIVDQLRLLQDQMPPFSFARARRLIEAELGAPLAEHFAELDAAPVAAASVAQVHRGRLHDGTEVAVKVLRPDIRRKVERDAAILLIVARVISWHPTWRLSDPVGHLRHFMRGIYEQTNLVFEVRNYDILRKNFAGFEGVRFPTVLTSLSGPRVMTMEFVRGTKIDALPEKDHKKFAGRLQHVILKMCFEDGFVHADLHPGNLLCADDGDLVIFDVGLVKQLGDDLLVQFTDFVRCLVMGGPEDFLAHVRRFHAYARSVDWEALRRDCAHLIETFRKQSVAELEMGALANDLFAMGRKHRVMPIPDMALVIVALVTAEGIGKQLHPENNLFQATATFLGPLVQKRGLLREAGRQAAIP
jgi:ubiquinone biosynthesis protein